MIFVSLGEIERMGVMRRHVEDDVGMSYRRNGFVVLYERPPFFVTDQTSEDALCVAELL